MKTIADFHVHSIASGHAYCTILELCQAARRRGLCALAVCDHGPAIGAGACDLHFINLRILPRQIEGVVLIRGAEANLLDNLGTVDLSERALSVLDFVIASLHGPSFEARDRAYHTEMYLAAAHNPRIHCLGHVGQSRYPFDHEAVVKACAQTGTLIEINNHSPLVRKGSEENCMAVARLCAEYGVPVLINSDAHFASDVGNYERSLALLDSIGFPHALILNLDRDMLAADLKTRLGVDILEPESSWESEDYIQA